MKNTLVNSVDQQRPGDHPTLPAEMPLRDEVYSQERLATHARHLAQAQTVTLKPPIPRRISNRLNDDEALLYKANRIFSQQVSAGRAVPPSAEWLLDNFHIVQDQIREIRQDLTRKFYAELPKLDDGVYRGYPRVYALAFELITHTDSRLDVETLTHFVAAYQEVKPLTLGELWALPIMLRVGLVENLRRLMDQSLVRLEARRQADVWADRLLAANHSDTAVRLALIELERSGTPDPEFAVELMQRLRDQDPTVAPVIQWLEETMAQSEADIEQNLRQLNQRRTVNRLSVGNAVTSMRTLSTIDWQSFVEELSLLERVLEQDPAGVYAQMDFATRDRYRHVVEVLAKRNQLTEPDVAQRAIALARQAPADDLRRHHIGYYIIDEGRTALRRALGYSPPLRDRLVAWVFDHGTLFYLGLSAVLWVCLMLAALAYAAQFNPPGWLLALTAGLVLLPVSVLAVNIVNWTLTVEARPHTPPKMEFKAGIPPTARTMVVVPALLSSVQGIGYLLEHLEQRYLANRDEHLFFAMLTDFADSTSEHRPEDQILLETAVRGIEALNAKYCTPVDGEQTSPDRFYLFHRERRWDAVAQSWMGWERKRGKLIEFNRVLRGATDTSYSTIIGDRSILPTIRYVITLDADTELPLNTARRLAGTLAHPLNHAVIDPQTNVVTEGYGIIQPRVDVTAEAASVTRFARIMTGDAGLDPYSSVVSDVYQDLFHTGVYIGKAIYDVDAMHAALDGRFPDNLLLSHDLLEGTFARAGLASDIVLMEDFPTGLDAFSQRQHRWARGDWQILQWCLPTVPDGQGKQVRNPLSWIDRWKIFDNLRRSLIPPALILLLVAGWTILPGGPIVWTLLGLGALWFALLRRILSALGVHPVGEPWRDYALALLHEVSGAVKRAWLTLSFVLFQASDNLDAILRALWRRMFNRRDLLEWSSAASVERGQARTLANYLARMWTAPLFALLIAGLVAFVNPFALWLALPCALLWFTSPALATWLGQPLPEERPQLDAAQRETLRALAEQMWRFYDRFASADDHWLPPDNYQTDPKPVVAHRTSPTNIGFYLLAVVAALDFKFIDGADLVGRLERVLGTLEHMERYAGHWYNWYDTLTLQPLTPRYVSTVDSGNLAAAFIVVKQACLELAESDAALAPRLRELAECIENLVRPIDFRFLYAPERELFAVGFNVETNQRDGIYYDLLASEARLTSYIAIALDQVPERHWFKLGRPLLRTQGRVALLSWGGTMFEYLMPTLFMPDYAYTLLGQTYPAIVARQVEYGREHGVPWGISESGFYAFDFQFNYQYRMFGVPDLSLKREFGSPLVVAPYATFLALPYAAPQAWSNLHALKRAGGADGYGYFEAVDYTPGRNQEKRPSVVREFMAHHQGMSLTALDNVLNDGAIRRRFQREPAMAAIELLLQERIPLHTPLVQTAPEERPPLRPVEQSLAPDTRVYRTPHTPLPRAHILSNGEYAVMLTNAGGSYSTYRDTAITRWHADATCDNWGTFLYVRDLTYDRVWSSGYQPTCAEPDEYRATFHPDGAEFWRQDGDIETQTEIFVSPEEGAEIRRVTLVNLDRREHTLELTSYAEIVLAPPRLDMAHPAFQKLFVESEFVPAHNLLLFERRPRDPNQTPLWAFHLVTGGSKPRAVEYETDRARFLGRGRTAANPAALRARLSNTTGAVLDPVMSLRVRVRLAAGEIWQASFVTGVAPSRADALKLGDKYADTRGVERTLEMARVHNHIVLQHLNISAADAQSYQRLASRVLYPEAAFRAPASVIARNRQGQSGLWAYGISGDFPIVLLRVHASDELDLVRQLLLAHEYWRMHNFQTDLVILDEYPTSYAEGLHVTIENMVRTSLSSPRLDKPGGIFVRRAEHMPAEDRILLQTVARVVLNGELGNLAQQLKLTTARDLALTRRRVAPVRARPPVPTRAPAPAEPRVLDNGIGGFCGEGREYVITLGDQQWTPAPWSNVLANPEAGTLVTEAGLGYSWTVNSQQNKLTPWSNDPVGDASGLVIYLQEEASQALWTPTPLPIREAEPYTIRHGAGSTCFEHTSHNVAQTLDVFVPRADTVTVGRLRLRNLAPANRRLRVTLYAEWVLGTTHTEEGHFIVTERDVESGALLARNPYNADLSHLAFAASSQPVQSFTADRTEFLGRNGSLALPLALAQRSQLSGAVGAGLDPCAALQMTVDLVAGQEQEIILLWGQGKDAADVRRLVEYYGAASNADAARQEVAKFWDEVLGTIQVKTPDQALDLLLNQRMLYQALACRMWARSAFYQSGGAYGFRDQLQDSMALVYATPQLAREHVLRAAGRQFVEGDVQHWWHPPLGKGVRTRISDDPLWLPFVVEHYVRTTGDTGVLDVQVPFLLAPALAPGQDEAYGEPDTAPDPASLYDHCLRALDHCSKFGEHGLPLMGTGDWNDGMNAVGAGGKGESVWLGWFLYTNLTRFAEICQQHGDAVQASQYREEARRLEEALHETAWDGNWFRRAYFDNGTPLGSAQNAECQIDAIAQAWAVLSQAAPEERTRAAMQAVEEKLVRRDDGLILLLTPPFDHSDPSPGYIQGYVPGIRENGGQYTHGVLWVVWAYLARGEGDRAYELLRLLNPLDHTRTREEVERYKVEPYVIAADVYAHPMHRGRGGWTWYTGSAAWMYRTGIEGLLGLRLQGDLFKVEPCLPHGWSGFHMTFRDGNTVFEIGVENPNHVQSGVQSVYLDGTERVEKSIPRLRDGKTHQVRVVLG